MPHCCKLFSLLNFTALLLGFHQSQAEIAESFDMTAVSGCDIGSLGARAGADSRGWMSTWQTVAGSARYSSDDLSIDSLSSAGGSIQLRGERKAKSIGRAVVMRQIDATYSGDVYGQFRFNSGSLHKDSVIGVLLSAPSEEPPTPKNAIFAICPKRWGSNYGMIGAGHKVAKVDIGAACEAFQNYLVLWKLENLPTPGKRKKIQLKMWVLSEAQASHFNASNFAEDSLLEATSGSGTKQVCQFAFVTIPNSKRTIARGMVLSLFNFSTPQLYFDEISVSDKNFKVYP
ncbi:MAG: hypothetical protein MK120_06120 [Puniceicoccaceae bacterium]|nr:hypothetical protein [Puniceicoccaceae bacterium]